MSRQHFRPTVMCGLAFLLILPCSATLKSSRIVKRQASTQLTCTGFRMNFQDPADCSRYYECVNNQVTNRLCPALQVFSPLNQNCGNYPIPPGCTPSRGQGSVGSEPSTVTYQCPSPTGRFQDTADCSRYYVCTNNQPQRQQCPAGNMFDPNAERCSNIHDPEGCHMPETHPSEPGQYQCATSHGTFHDTSDCSRYYVCSNFQADMRQCPSGQQFDPTTNICSNTARPLGCHVVAAGERTFTCPTAFGNYQDVADCTKYWRCTSNEATSVQCPANQMFDPATFQCSSTVTSVAGCTMATETFRCPSLNGNYQDSNDCSRYWRCVNNVATNTACQVNQLFDPRTLQCSSAVTTVTGCRRTTVTPPLGGTSTQLTCPGSRINVQDPADCSRYYECVNNQVTSRLCPALQVFSPLNQNCGNYQIPPGCTPSAGSESSTVTYQCPSPTGRFQDTADCSRYYVCTNNQPQRQQCPAGNMFDPNAERCSNIHDPEGCHMPETHPSEPGQYQCPTSHGTFHDTSDCSRYYVCSNFQADRRQCPSGQQFDPTTNICSNTARPLGCHVVTAAGERTFTCPTTFGNYQDPNDCTKYWRCTSNEATSVQCPANQMFDPATFQCSSTVTSVAGCTMATETFRCPNSNGNYQDSNDCSRYWRCVNSIATNTQCPSNQLFDTRTLQCSSTITTVTGCRLQGTLPPLGSGTFQCPVANGNYQDTTDCSRYWRCINNAATNIPCPVNQLFDTRTLQCSSTITTVSGCTMPGGANPPSGSRFRCPTSNGNYQDTADCSRYWRCVQNVATNIPCPLNQLFDPRTFECSSAITTATGCTLPPGWSTLPGSSFQCPTPGGNYQDVTDCSRYWRCTNSQATNIPCQLNQLFDTRTFECSSAITFVSGCTMPVRSGSGTFTCPVSNGNYQDGNDCSRYWRCVNNQATNIPCPANQLFDTRTLQCSSSITTVAGCIMPTMGFACPASTGNYQDRNDCTRYWRCENNRATNIPCFTNQLFNPATLECSSSITFVAGCTMPVRPIGFTCPSANGNFQDVTDCSRYWRCVNNAAANTLCPINQLFDTRTAQCSSTITFVSGCTMPARENPAGTFRCPNFNGNYQNTGDCSRYWRCVNNVATNTACPLSQLFDPRTNQCSSTITTVAGCTMPMTAGNFRCPRSSGEFPYPADCSRYWRCDNNEAVLRRCTGTLLFNAARGYCDFNTALGANPGCSIVANPAPVPPPSDQVTCPRTSNAMNIPHPRLCNAFYMCGLGIVHRPCIFCGEGTYFDPSTHVCIGSAGVDMITVCPGKVMMPHGNKTQAQADGC